jgi:putative nucleotidyltransferase with HDIG domain
MHQQQQFSRAGYAYVTCVIAAGVAATTYSVIQLVIEPVSNQWLILAALTLLTGSFSVKIPSIAARISVSDAFVFASVLLFGPAPATVIVAVDCFVISLWLRDENRSPVRSLFNLSAVALAIWLASQGFFWLVDVRPGDLTHLLPLEKHLWQLFALASSYFLLNSWLVAIALGFEKRQGVVGLWWRNFPWFSLNYFGGVSVAALLVSYTRSVDLSAIGIIVPLLIISYLTHRTSLGRIEDSKRHVEQLSDLYLSTIETLAMAVDAKDQITHGHIRRVQVYALELAKLLGVKDERQLKAIEAAALLHDMGKLAIPEHILNKPGKLTGPEFEKMKLHADIGADLLSAVKFPYPVVPIVRHHHEQWSGKGYPSGIAGTDIPLGARILAVVDCFDALTSDRPYRPRLTTEEAFAIILEARGSLYDPLVVDAFLTAYPHIAPSAMKAGAEATSLMRISDVSDQGPTSPLQQIRASATETSVIEAYRDRVGAARTSADALAAAAECLRQLTAATHFVFYRYDKTRDALTGECAIGDRHEALKGLTIALGTRVSGWSAATRRVSVNADASLDLNQIATRYSPSLRCTLSVPVVNEDALIGVFTAYASQPDAFKESDRYTFEQVVTEFQKQVLRNPHPRSVVAFPLHRL